AMGGGRPCYADFLWSGDGKWVGKIWAGGGAGSGRPPPPRRSFKPVVGENSIFVADGAEWRWQRRAAAPIFRHETILSFVPLFAAWRSDKAKIDISSYQRLMVLIANSCLTDVQ